MSDSSPTGPEIERQFKELGIDKEHTFRILEAFNAGRYDSVEPIRVSGLPTVDGARVLDLTGAFEHRIGREEAEASLRELGVEIDLRSLARLEGEELRLDRSALDAIGRRLYPLVSYGVLNGGSATSYTDITRNRAFNETILELCREAFDRVASLSKGRAKGITPAFVHPDGTPGPSYVELKMRSLLIEELRYRALTGKDGPALFPMFQMTSVNNDEEIAAAYREYRGSPLLEELIRTTGIDITNVRTGVQPMLAAYTHESEGRPRRVFTDAFGQEGRLLPLPGGHGQNFEVLKEVYRSLYRDGKRFVVLGNVDNLGNTLDPAEIALLALTGKQAGFDFAFKTPVDVKGGILVIDQQGRLDCADIGPAISPEEVARAEDGGTPILFNCATGIFDLRYLTENVDRIVEELPMRWSNQHKDAGSYSQAEQVTWEIIGMLDDFYVFGVDKYDRFLAAKLLIESLMTSGVGLEEQRYPADSDPSKDLKGVASKLHAGLKRKLETVYGMYLERNRWHPLTVSQILDQRSSQ